MGLPQIMGFNHQRIVYANVQEMFNAFQADERNHVLGLFDFINADANICRAMQPELCFVLPFITMDRARLTIMAA